jgi:hypothetical protein
MTGTLFDPPEDARQPAKARGIAKHEDKSTRITPRAPARRTAPTTSRAAARRAKRGAIPQAVRLVQYLAARGDAGATNAEAAAALDMLMSSVTARCRGLVQDELVCDSGRTRPTPSGCDAIVWILTGAGAAVAMSTRAPESPAAARAEPDAPVGGAA